MSETPLRIAIIGTGNISQVHYDGYRAAGATVVALCDVDPIQLAARARTWGVERTYTDLDELFAAGGFEAVSIAAPTAVHHPATVAAAKAGVHVLVEKPIALDLTLADEMVAACADAGVVLSVNHQMRSSGPARRAKELLEAGAIGRVTHLRLRQAHDWGGKGVRPSFATKASSGGGTLLDNGCHLADLARFFGGRIREVYARAATLAYDIEIEDTANVSLEFADGAIGTIETAWTATGWEEGFWLYGTKGALESTNRLGAPDLRHYYRQSAGGTWDQTDLTTHSFSGYSPHVLHVISFVAAIKGEGPNVCSGEDGREAVRLILAAYASAAEGTPVRLADAPEALENI